MQDLAADMVLTGMQWRVGWSPWTLWSSCLLEHCPAVEREQGMSRQASVLLRCDEQPDRWCSPHGLHDANAPVWSSRGLAACLQHGCPITRQTTGAYQQLVSAVLRDIDHAHMHDSMRGHECVPP